LGVGSWELGVGRLKARNTPTPTPKKQQRKTPWKITKRDLYSNRETERGQAIAQCGEVMDH